MKKILLAIAFVSTLSFHAKAQFNLSGGLTYTNYGSEISKSTPGLQIRGAYNIREKQAVALGVSYGLPIKQTVNDGTSNFEQTTTFIGVNFGGILHLIGTYEDNFSLYFPVSVGYVMGTSKYAASGTLPVGTVVPENDKLNGLTVNANVGLQFKIGVPFVFAEAGFALPAGNTSNTRTGTTGNNPVPSHSVLSIGVRLPFGSSGVY